MEAELGLMVEAVRYVTQQRIAVRGHASEHELTVSIIGSIPHCRLALGAYGAETNALNSNMLLYLFRLGSSHWRSRSAATANTGKLLVELKICHLAEQGSES
jgi:hypothetical protein